MARLIWVAALGLCLGAPTIAWAQLDSGSGEVASRAVNTPLPERHKPPAKKAGCAKVDRSAKGRCPRAHH